VEFSDFERQVFLDEVEEKLEALSQNILVLEREHENEEAVKEMFRAAHTIKGSSAIMGFQKMTLLTHEMESILDRIRGGILKVNTDIINLLFECIDSLKLLQEEIISEEDDFVIEPIVKKIKAMFEPEVQETSLTESSPLEGQELNDIDLEVIKDAQVNGLKPIWITVTVEEECQMKGVRAYLVFHNLQDFGEVIKCDPNVEDIQDGNFEEVFKVLLLSNEEGDMVRASLQGISEIKSIEINELFVDYGKEETILESKTEAGQVGPELKQVDNTTTENKTKPNNSTPENQSKKPNTDKKPAQTVRVNVDKLDKLMNLVGELVIDRGRLTQVTNELGVRIGTDELVEHLGEITSHLAQVANELQDEIMKARMLPVDQVFNRFPRMVRDIAQKLSKDIEFNISGGETELDRTVIEAIGDPLVHIIRNAADHGIESPEERKAIGKTSIGTINLSARHQENYVLITVEDDGKGLDPEKLKAKAIEKGLISEEEAKLMSSQEALEIIFYPGFSTTQTVNDVSGRGVGMDIVRTHIQSINGTVEIDSQIGYGATFYIKLPLTLAIIQALLVKVKEQMYAFPLVNVTEILKVTTKDIKFINEQEVIVMRGEILPLYPLAELFGLTAKGSHKEQKGLFVVVVGIGEKRVGIVVDDLLGEQEIVIKTLGKYIGEIAGISGATILGDGKVALILDVRGLMTDISKDEKRLKVI